MYRNTLKALVCLIPALLLPGCGALKPSPAWSAATSLDIPGKGDYEQSQAYAQGAAHALAQRGIPNRLVTFRYAVADERNNPRIITRSAVIYRDDTRLDYPWWMVDNILRLPVWLPNGSVEDQVHFVTRYEPEIIEVRDAKLNIVETEIPCPAAPTAKAKEALFLKYNGTPYDPSSSMDQKKMAELCQSAPK